MFVSIVSRGLWAPPTLNVTAPAIVDCIGTVVSTPAPTESLASLSGLNDSATDTGCASDELTSAAGGSDLESS